MIKLAELTQSPEIISLTATLDSALCVGAGGSSGSLADKPILRDSQGRLLIPASQMKGRLRHECEKLARGLKWPICQSPVPDRMCPQRNDLPPRNGEPENFNLPEYELDQKTENPKHHCLICQIFGNPALPSRVLFDDLICEQDPEMLPEVLRPGVSINRRRGTAEEKKLFLLETSPANAQLKFEGEIRLLPSCPHWAKPLLLAGLSHVHALGGGKTGGLGWLSWKPIDLKIDPSSWEFLGQAGGRR